MSGHLSGDQFSAWLAGEPGLAERQHLEQCSQCRAEAARLETAMSQFGAAVRQWSGQQAGAVRYPRAAAERRLGRWLLAVSALLVLVLMPLYQDARDRRQAREQAEADAMLLERVNRAVSRSVPRPMEPLIQLVEWGSVPAKGNEKQ